MKKEPTKKKKTKDTKKTLDPISKENEVPNTENESPFNFGGLPARDLKKNLGCG